ncbi:LarC family nickel insertion protein [Pseudodesulfovibrio sp.]|uniref:LarC family nickel insertion protein n=1 Tax=Pseudodesulfovibrio sp. TaxID=2035812 RepID=UPI0026339F17|nr:LarC family nickel insertion protein [Pseudodesulfovibrio sp.]MDD3310523.1 LarC family nickel insertion protein [Pseudodesulfovibrio sp.]
MRTLYLDCSSGVSGDMLLSAMAHALEETAGPGNGFARLGESLDRLGLAGFALHWSQKKVGGIATWHLDVEQTADQPLRTYSNLVKIVEDSALSPEEAKRAIQALTLLGRAEAKVHGVDLETVHFHEIGAVDTIVDVVGAMVLLEALEAVETVVSPVDLGSGFVTCAHGKMPVPAPACAELAKGLATFGSDCGMERATPTGLAILRTIARDCGPQPMGRVLAVGYGSGGRSCDEQPTYVRAFLLETVVGKKPVRHHHSAHHHA